jgi:hypothetical protein
MVRYKTIKEVFKQGIMNDCKFIELDTSLPKLIKEVLDYQIDWESDEDRNRYYDFRNRVEGLMDKYYGGDPSDMVNSLEDFYFCYTCEDKNRELYDYMWFTRYSDKVIKEVDNAK